VKNKQFLINKSFETATQEIVAREASEWNMEVEEWLDQVHTHLREQHPESNYSFISIDADTKMASFSCTSSFL
jgi:hypothetical protein